MSQNHTSPGKGAHRWGRSLLLVALLLAPHTVDCQNPPPSQPADSRRAGGGTSGMSAEEIFRRFASRILFLTCDESADEFALASGVLVSADGFIVTNAHVVEGCRSMAATYISGTSRRPYEPVLKYYDEQSDTAVLKIAAEGLNFFSVHARPARIGERVYAIGNPRGLEQSISEGIVSGNRTEDGVSWIQHSAPISPGSSGGALISAQGELLGINSRTRKESQNLNFAVPSDTLAEALSIAQNLTGSLKFPAAGPSVISRSPGPVAPGPVKVNPKDGLRYTWISPGSFSMGCSANDTECEANEKPTHPVTITKGFWLGQTAVTVEAYQYYAARTSNPMPPARDLRGRNINAKADDYSQPVVGVTWYEARDFCSWAAMRLPTEAEWEYAARAGSSASRYGDLDDIAWYADNSGRLKIDSARIWQEKVRANNGQLSSASNDYHKLLKENGNGPKPVGQLQPNAWKLYDMLGNVGQWVADWFGLYEQTEAADPLGPPNGQYRVHRGGAWDNLPTVARESSRGWNEPLTRDSSNGFRCAGELP